MLEQHVTLHDGEKVLFRPLKPEDASLYPDFLSEVTTKDLRLRFFVSMREVRPDLIDSLIHYDPAHAMAACMMVPMALVPNSRSWSAPTSRVTGLAG